MSVPEPSPESAAVRAYSRLQQAAQRVVEAADELDGAGGLGLVVPTWTAKAHDRARVVLAEAIVALQSAMDDLGQPPKAARPKPRPKPPEAP